jgi:pyrroline-5-carboxylate reductase
MSFTLHGPLLMAGAGKMGGALLARLLSRGLDPRDVLVQDPNPPPEMAELLVSTGIDFVPVFDALSAPPSVILLAVKPQMIEAVLPQLATLAAPQTLILSIAAGRTLAGLEAHVSNEMAVVRAMPNTPAMVGSGITVCVANAHVSAEQRALAEELLAAAGDVVWVADEALLDPATAVSGSGPAYVFLLAECLAEAGRKAGLPAELAERLARVTVSGAGDLLRESETPAAELRRNVTSPGGTTEAALEILGGPDGLQKLMTDAVAAATRRGRDLEF